jgi:hypothetical protein
MLHSKLTLDYQLAKIENMYTMFQPNVVYE